MANEELDEIQTHIDNEVVDGLKDPARYEGEELGSKSAIEARVRANPVRALRWCRDRTNFYFEAFIELTSHDGEQGIRIFRKSDDTLVRELRVPMGGGDSGKPRDQIFKNNRVIIGLLVQYVLAGSTDLDALEADMAAAISDGRSNPIGFAGGDLAGVSPGNAGFARSPCRVLKWLSDNSPYYFKSFAKITDTGGSQGLLVYQDDAQTLVKTVSVPIGGGKDANPRKDIYKNNRRILLRAVDVVWKKIQNGGW